MTHRQMESELARATGESRATIRQRGFQFVDPSRTGPNVVDWDARARLNVLPWCHSGGGTFDVPSPVRTSSSFSAFLFPGTRQRSGRRMKSTGRCESIFLHPIWSHP